MQIRCKSVMVAFSDRNLAKQEITTAHPTGSQQLVVTRDANFITIAHINKVGQVLEQINFNVTDIKEYACCGVEGPAPVSFLPSGGKLPNLESVK